MSQGKINKRGKQTRKLANFFKDYKLDSTHGFMQFRSHLKNLIALIYRKLHSKSCNYTYEVHLSQIIEVDVEDVLLQDQK